MSEALGADERDHRAVRARLSDRGVALREDVLRRRRGILAQALGATELSTTADEDLRRLAGRLRTFT